MDPKKRAMQLRNTLASKDGRILVVDFSKTQQRGDTSKIIDAMPNAEGKLVFRTKANIKPIDAIASRIYKTEFFDASRRSDDDIKLFVNRQEFDFPLWWMNHAGFSMQKIHQYNLPFILQVAGCNFHNGTRTGGCHYCFVDDKSNDGLISEGKTFLGIADTIGSMERGRENVKALYKEKGIEDMDMKVLRISGGEPTIVLDWALGLWREIEKRRLDIVGQLDTNLSTGTMIDAFEHEGIYEKNILKKLSEFPVKILAGIKGISDENLRDNVQAAASMTMQYYSLKKLIKAGLDVYPQAYNPDPERLAIFLSLMDDIFENFSLRLHIGQLKSEYLPTQARLTAEAKALGADPKEFISKKDKEWKENYRRNCEIMDDYLRENHGVGYQQVARPEIKMVIKD